MATVQGPSMTIHARGGVISVTAFYDDVTGKPVRVETSNTTTGPYRIRLALANGSRQISAVVQAGTASINITWPLANNIDMRPYGDDVGELAGVNPTEWLMELFI